MSLVVLGRFAVRLVRALRQAPLPCLRVFAAVLDVLQRARDVRLVPVHDQGDVELVPEGGCPAEDEAGEGGDAEGGVVVEQLAHGLASPQGVLEVRLVVAADVERQAELQNFPRFHQPTAPFLHGLPLFGRWEELSV